MKEYEVDRKVVNPEKLKVGDGAVDGGRAYFRRVGELDTPAKYMKIVDGKFVEMIDE
jgi:hypothetical protein